MGKRRQAQSGEWVVVKSYRALVFQVVRSTWARIWVEQGWPWRPKKYRAEDILAICPDKATADAIEAALWKLNHQIEQEHDALSKRRAVLQADILKDYRP